jgi:hypothetical protein
MNNSLVRHRNVYYAKTKKFGKRIERSESRTALLTSGFIAFLGLVQDSVSLSFTQLCLQKPTE